MYIYYRGTVGTDIGTAGVLSVQTRHFEFAEMLIFRDETSCTQSSVEVFFKWAGHLKHSLVSGSSRQTRLFLYYHKR